MRFFALFLCTMLGALPARAGLFDSAPEKPVPVKVSDGTIQQIQSAFDDQRYLDAGKILDLTGNNQLEAFDQDVGVVILKTLPAIGTDLTGDDTAAGKGVVKE